MSTKPVRISDRGHKILSELAQQDNKSMTDILDEVLEAERKRRFFESINAGYLALKSDPEAWAEELKERELFDNTLMDGLDQDEVWHTEVKDRG